MTDHRCARGNRCARTETVSYDHCAVECQCHLGPHYLCSVPGGCGHLHKAASADVGAMIEHQRGLCSLCELVVADALADLPQDYVSLRAAQHRGVSPATGELVMATKDLPVPISLTLTTLADQIEIETTAFAEPVAEKLHIDWDRATTPRAVSRYGVPPRYSGSVILNKAANLLRNSVYTLLNLPTWEYRLWGEDGWVEVAIDGVGAALTLLALHHAARSTLGLTRAVMTMQARCPWCRAQSIVHIAGKAHKECQLCLVKFTEREYEQLTIITINDHPKPPKKPQRFGPQLSNSVEGSVGRPMPG